MKTIFTTAAVLALAALTGCAVQQPGYYTAARVQDPYQWHTVEVTPAGGQTATYTEAAPASRVVYTTEPVYTTSTYVTQPVYVTAPAYYAPAPAYYYPPVSIGLDFSFGRYWGGGGRGWGGRGYHRR
jgi:predicted small lipoprotein YifL